VISTFLVEHSWLTFAGLLAVLIVGPVLAYLLSKRRGVASCLAGISVAAVLVITTYPESRTVMPGCEVSLPYLSLGAVESVANVILFVPPVLFGAVASRRPLVALAGGVVLSALIELVQLAAPVFGRSCDTSDLICNAIGAVIGAAVAAAGLRVAASRRRAR